jgi:hypothetical protein
VGYDRGDCLAAWGDTSFVLRLRLVCWWTSREVLRHYIKA